MARRTARLLALDPLETSDYRLGSVMMAAALDEFDPTAQSAAGHAFTEWTGLLAVGIAEAGLDNSTARSIGGLLLSVIEGTIVQSRALQVQRNLRRCSPPAQWVVEMSTRAGLVGGVHSPRRVACC
ncbi:hypothetical protein G8767_27100 [Rhodococcus sp. IC4_135]|uniref:LmrA/YxaF family transcription factor n=1 Tax=Rhodococcus sp. IC4_135 TaxID=2715537 RepID=UPI00141DA0A5|nr:hypothetical protein [Rhodococcus sp. IC4_135]